MSLFLRAVLDFLIQVAPFAVMCFYPFGSYYRFSRRKTVLSTAFLLLGLALVYAMVSSLVWMSLEDSPWWQFLVNLTFLGAVVCCFLWYFYAIRAIFAKKLFVFFFVIAGTFDVNVVYNYFFAHPSSGPVNGAPFFLRYSLVLTCYLPLLWLFFKYCYLPIEECLNAKESRYLSALTLLLSALTAYGFFFIDYDLLRADKSVFFLLVLLLASIAFVYFLFFRMYYLIHESHQVQQKAMQIQYQMELRDEQYKRIHESMESSRRRRHDLKHHLLVLKSFWDNGTPEKIGEYLEQYFGMENKNETLPLCENPIVNMLVSHYAALAGESGIAFHFHIAVPKELQIATPDLSVLLGNLLDNAVEAAARAPKECRDIQLNMICSGKMLAVTVDNGFDGIVCQNGAAYISMKPGHSGLGLKSLADIADKYNGGVEFSHDGMTFHASVMLGCV